MTAPTDDRPPMDIAGLADYLGVSAEWVRTQVKARAIPFTRLAGGRLVRFTPQNIAEMFDAGYTPPQHIPTRDEVAERRRDARRRAS